MAYEKQNFLDGQIITADHLNHIEDGIVAAADAETLGGKAPAYYLQPRNLLDNSDFTNPVNQRGQSSYSGNFVRSIDRWLAAEGASGSVSVEIEDGGITFTTSGGGIVYLIQRFEKGYLDLSKQHTIVAYMADGTVSVDGYIDTSEETMDGVNVTFPSGSKIKCVALYEGVYTADTLPPYVPKGYGAELAECQRYYFEIPFGGAFIFRKRNEGADVYAAFEICPPIVFPTRMRIVPTVTLSYDITDGEAKSGGPLSCTTGSCSMPNVGVPINGWFDLNKVVASADL